MTTEKLVDWINAELYTRNLSQTEASKRAGLNPNAISDIVNGAIPGLKVCKGLAAGFGASVVDVLRMAGHLPPASRRNDQFSELTSMFSRLSWADQKVVLRLVRGFLHTSSDLYDDAETVRIMSPPRMVRETMAGVLDAISTESDEIDEAKEWLHQVDEQEKVEI